MITKSELIEYLKHTPENTNYNILYSSLYNGSNKEIVDEFIEVLSRGNLSLAALQPYLAKLYEDDKTISPEPLPPLFIGGSPDAVLYTEQTLTEAQKKQARDNLDAAGEFVIHATPTSDRKSATLDKTFAQIQEAINAGKTPIVLMNNRAYLPIANVDTDYIAFSGASGDDRGAYFATLYVYPSQDPQLSNVFSVVLNTDETMPQVSMESDPTDDMEIATKKYVDDALDGKAGTAVVTASANGLMSKDDKAKLDGITGQVTAANIHAPEHTTDLVQYGAFQIAAQQIISQIPTVPDVLPNPKALVIKIGSTTVTYDGSAAKTVEIADVTE